MAILRNSGTMVGAALLAALPGAAAAKPASDDPVTTQLACGVSNGRRGAP